MSEHQTAIVSACLLGFPCRHDGRDKRHAETLARLESRGLAVVPVCPEVAGGLAVPRAASVIEGERVLDADGRDVTAHFSRGAQAALDAALAHGATLAILKQNSPSCGSHTIGTARGRAPGVGRAATALFAAGLELHGEDAAW